jgi:hypothetical protein
MVVRSIGQSEDSIKYEVIIMSYTNQEQKVVGSPPMEDIEPIAAEVQANASAEPIKSLDGPWRGGYRMDNEGNSNNYAVEPKMYQSKYPSQKQQRLYILLGAAAILFIALTIWIAFAAS